MKRITKYQVKPLFREDADKEIVDRAIHIIGKWEPADLVEDDNTYSCPDCGWEGLGRFIWNNINDLKEDNIFFCPLCGKAVYG